MRGHYVRISRALIKTVIKIPQNARPAFNRFMPKRHTFLPKVMRLLRAERNYDKSIWVGRFWTLKKLSVLLVEPIRNRYVYYSDLNREAKRLLCP